MNNSNNSAPHAHLLGARVALNDSVKVLLNVTWTEGVIAAVFDTPQGVGIHVCNPETGAITKAVTLDSVKLHESATKLLQATGEMNASVLSQIMTALTNGGF